MTKPNNKAFREVLDKFIHIGNCYYNAKHYDNVLNIFNDLERTDQRTLLLGVYHLYAIMEHGVVPGTDQPNVKPKPDVAEALKTPEHDKAMVELKIWIVKVLVSAALLIFICLVLIVIFFGGPMEEGTDALSKTIKIFSLLF